MGSAVVLVPIARRKNEILAVGYVTARIIESVFIAIGIICVLGIVSLRKDGAGADAADLAVSLAALKDWTFLLGPGFVVGWGNGLILGYLMYRSGLMPRNLAISGLVGGPLLILTGTLAMFGVIQQGGSVQGVATAPEFIWELGPRHLPDRLGIPGVVADSRPRQERLRLAHPPDSPA